MFNDTFFPTPPEVVKQMVQPWRVHEHHYISGTLFLEPSAGKGDICDALVADWKINPKLIRCIESESELQAILQDKGYALIDDNFLQYGEPMRFDRIIMNPPFEEGPAHLLHAWNILADGGSIACLLNAETLRNPHTSPRQRLTQIIADYGSSQEIGQAFKTAERTSNVEVVIVWLDKPDADTGIPEYGTHFDTDAPQQDAEYDKADLAPRDMYEALVAQYEAAAQLLVDQQAIRRQYNFYTGSVLPSYSNARLNLDDLNSQIDGLKAGFWDHVFEKTKLGGRLTSGFLKDFQKKQQQVSHMAFNLRNIMTVFEHFVVNQNEIVLQCIGEVFDKATAYHKDNVIHDEGWVTNKSWKVAPKIIMPNTIDFDHKHPEFSPWNLGYYDKRDFLKDIDRALCFVTGEKVEDIITTTYAVDVRLTGLNRKLIDDYSSLFSSHFFTIRIYKKGTVHLIFKNLDLLARFNQIAAQNKGWLGSGV